MSDVVKDDTGVRMWPHLDESEEKRRLLIAERSLGIEEFDDSARTVLTLSELVYHEGLELNMYADAPDYPFAGGSSWLSWKLCDMKDIAEDGTWLEGESAELQTSDARFEALVDSGDLGLQEIMAANPRCPGELIDRMVRVPEVNYDYEQVRFCAAHNPATPATTLTWLIERDYTPDEDSESEDDDPSTEVREIALGNPATPVETLVRWSDFRGHETWSLDNGFSERSSVAANWALPLEVMSSLSVDESENVRAAIARNPCCPVTLLEQLSLDSGERGFVRRAILVNPSSSDLAREQASGERT